MKKIDVTGGLSQIKEANLRGSWDYRKGGSVLDPLDRHNPMATNVIDLTHESIHEIYWKPIVRKPEPKPADNVLKDKLLLKDWEQTQVNEYFSWIYDRRAID